MVDISLSDPFVIALSVIVPAGMLVFLLNFMLPDRYASTKRAVDFAFSVVWASTLYFYALHVNPDMSMVRFTGFTAVYFATVIFHSWRAMRVRAIR